MNKIFAAAILSASLLAGGSAFAAHHGGMDADSKPVLMTDIPVAPVYQKAANSIQPAASNQAEDAEYYHLENIN